MKILDGLNQYWGLITFMGGVIFQMVWTYFQVGEHKTRIVNLETVTRTSDLTINGIREQISGIDAKLDILLDGYHKNKKQ